jgi:SAM-dependent methyltransferase
MKNKEILDVCCGSKMFWFTRDNPDVLFADVRKVRLTTVGKGRWERKFEVNPDVMMDFRGLDLPDNSFSLVVFDPPHLVRAGTKSHMAFKYGKLDKETWPLDLAAGFAECFRVLKPKGVLIFKWNEYQIPLSKVLELTPEKPLFGHVVPKRQQTHWITFMKGL